MPDETTVPYTERPGLPTTHCMDIGGILRRIFALDSQERLYRVWRVGDTG
jgi:hypothetical protein